MIVNARNRREIQSYHILQSFCSRGCRQHPMMADAARGEPHPLLSLFFYLFPFRLCIYLVFCPTLKREKENSCSKKVSRRGSRRKPYSSFPLEHERPCWTRGWATKRAAVASLDGGRISLSLFVSYSHWRGIYGAPLSRTIGYILSVCIPRYILFQPRLALRRPFHPLVPTHPRDGPAIPSCHWHVPTPVPSFADFQARKLHGVLAGTGEPFHPRSPPSPPQTSDSRSSSGLRYRWEIPASRVYSSIFCSLAIGRDVWAEEF